MTRFVSITSGKGGVGKTSLGINLALHLSRSGLKTCLFDADLGLANINVLLGVYPEQTLKDVISGQKQIRDVLITPAEELDILPGSSGVEEMVRLDREQIERLIQSFQSLTEYDFFIIDTSAGISRDVIAFCLAAPEVLVVLTPEPTSLTDAYALVKILIHNGYRGKIRVVLNHCKSGQHARLAYAKFKSAVNKFLGAEVASLGVIYEDRMVPQAVARQKPVLSAYPKAAASICIRKIADRLMAEAADASSETEMKTFWEQCLSFFKQSLNYRVKSKDLQTAEKTAAETSPEIEPKKGQAAEPESVDAPGTGAADPATNAGSEIPETAAVKKDAGSDVSLQSDSSAPPAPDNHTESDRRTTPEGALTRVVEKLNDTLTTVVDELIRMRQSFEKMGAFSNHSETAHTLRIEETSPEPVVLDFQNFLKQRQADGKDM